MGRIVILDEVTANQIAAGEVIERPASVVKEMVENALDAGASAITVDIVNGGIKGIRVTDNGEGIGDDDVTMAFERHATSKIRRIDDLNSLSSMGFRGEALASIASVSKVEVVTKTEEAKNGIKVTVDAGSIISSEPVGAPKGTTFIVRELFYNTPARYKFLKKDAAEAGYIQDILHRIALSRPDVSIKLISQGKTVLHTPGNHDLPSVIYSLYGKEVARAVLPVNACFDGAEVSGYIGKPEISRGNRSHQTILVNGRSVHNRIITAALEEAYKTRLMQKRFPFAVLKLQIPPQSVDVNVHPSKLEVRFSDDRKVFHAVYHAVTEALTVTSLIPGRQGDASIVLRRLPSENLTNPEQHGEKDHTSLLQPMEGHRDASIVLRGLPSKNLTNPEQHGEKDHTSLPQLLEEKTYVQDRNTSAVTEAEQLRIAEGEQEMLPVSRDEREKLLHARILGQAFKSFIILEDGEELYLIDQHAAHERIRYEKIKKQFAEGKSLGQGLISPITVNMSQLEMNLFKERSGYFEKFGFEAEDFGDRAVIIRAVPSILDGGFSSRDFLDILEKLCQEIPAVSEIIPEETLYMMACQSAIKANRSMSVMEIRGLVEDLVKLKNPYTCVHGRPIIISMNRKELDKRFKRIV